jgi:membrane dipeptidase
MNPLRFVLSVLLLSSFLSAQAVSPRARAIHDSAIIVDTHADTPQRFLYENFDIGTTDPKDIGHISLDKARAVNLGA